MRGYRLNIHMKIESSCDQNPQQIGAESTVSPSCVGGSNWGVESVKPFCL